MLEFFLTLRQSKSGSNIVFGPFVEEGFTTMRNLFLVASLAMASLGGAAFASNHSDGHGKQACSKACEECKKNGMKDHDKDGKCDCKECGEHKEGKN